MKLLKNYRIHSIALLSLMILGVVVGYAQNFSNKAGELLPQLKITLLGTISRGDKQVLLNNAGNVNPGEVIDWTIVSENTGSAPANSQDAVAQIPNGTTYVSRSANSQGQTVVSYSIDGGKTFSTQPMIAERQSNGTVKQIPAPVSMYSQIRFHWDNQLNVASERKATYSVRVK